MAFFFSKSKAQSAVHFCDTYNTYGFCYGSKTAMLARECANKHCLENGGTQPVVVSWTEKQGFGSICVGKDTDNTMVMGVALGFDSQDEARDAARAQCEGKGALRMKIEHRWEDN